MASKGSTEPWTKSRLIMLEGSKRFRLHLVNSFCTFLRVFVALPADTIHAGGFVLLDSRQSVLPRPRKLRERIFPESASTFYFLPLWNGREEVKPTLLYLVTIRSPIKMISLLMKKWWKNYLNMFWIGIPTLCLLNLKMCLLKLKRSLWKLRPRNSTKFPKLMFAPSRSNEIWNLMIYMHDCI